MSHRGGGDARVEERRRASLLRTVQCHGALASWCREQRRSDSSAGSAVLKRCTTESVEHSAPEAKSSTLEPGSVFLHRVA